MQIKDSDWQWLDAHLSIASPDLAGLTGMSESELEELVKLGSLVPLAHTGRDLAGRAFSTACVPSLQEAARLRARFDLDLSTVSLLVGYLQRIVHLEQQVRMLQPHPPHPPHPSMLPREGPTLWREPHA
jgi:chaperone modulatory protein CbpM